MQNDASSYINIALACERQLTCSQRQPQWQIDVHTLTLLDFKVGWPDRYMET